MLKLVLRKDAVIGSPQPPLGGCVLKQPCRFSRAVDVAQPPLGGCVLKRRLTPIECERLQPAAFRRLCVETVTIGSWYNKPCQPPLGGCVLKREPLNHPLYGMPSRL